MAERVGFEPTSGDKPETPLAGERLRPDSATSPDIAHKIVAAAAETAPTGTADSKTSTSPLFIRIVVSVARSGVSVAHDEPPFRIDPVRPVYTGVETVPPHAGRKTRPPPRVILATAGRSGERGIRTPGTRKGPTVFKTDAFVRSAISPLTKIQRNVDTSGRRPRRPV